MDLRISFDTTGSMFPYISEVRNRVQDFTGKMFAASDDLRISIVSHGDYCDGPRWLNFNDFSRDADEVQNQVRRAPRTNGGDYPEAYEAVLRRVRTADDWRDDVQKILVMIGDAYPHERRPKNKGILWRDEVRANAEAGITTYAVKCGRDWDSRYFWEGITTHNGVCVDLAQIGDIVELLLAIPYHQTGTLDKWEALLKTESKWTRTLAQIKGQLGGTVTVGDFKEKELEVVEPGRFQMLTVPADCVIKAFVEDTGADFKRGKGFYQLTKRVLVQERKVVVLLDESTGDLYTGTKAREMIGLPFGARGYITPRNLRGLRYTVFIQSTSYNRKLLKGTRFLYDTE